MKGDGHLYSQAITIVAHSDYNEFQAGLSQIKQHLRICRIVVASVTFKFLTNSEHANRKNEADEFNIVSISTDPMTSFRV